MLEKDSLKSEGVSGLEFRSVNMFFTCHFDVCKYVVSCSIIALMPAMGLE